MYTVLPPDAAATLGRRFFLRAELRAPLHALRTQRGDGSEATVFRPALVAGLGAGATF